MAKRYRQETQQRDIRLSDGQKVKSSKYLGEILQIMDDNYQPCKNLTLNFNFPARGKITGQLKFGDSKANLEYNENNQVVISGDANFLVEMKNRKSITAGELAKRLIGVLEQHKTSEGGFGTFYYRSNEEEYTGSFYSGGTGISALFVAQKKQ